MHGLVDAQSLAIRPVQQPGPLAGHLFRPHERLESDEFRTGARLDPVQEIRERKTDPGNHHGPSFDATQAVNPFLHRHAFDNVLERVIARFRHISVYLNGPWRSREGRGIACRIVLLIAELVEIVVGRNVFETVRLFVRRKPARLHIRDRGARQLACNRSGEYCAASP